MLLAQVKAWTPSTEEERAAVLTQLERLLQNPHFHKSKRFPIFLRFVVTEALASRGENLKERTLGVEVFGKDPSYETTDDPIVRVTAGEIRKRIAQYYQEPGHEHEIKILLPPGSYIPQFFPANSSVLTESTETEKDDSGSQQQLPARRRRTFFSPKLISTVLLFLLLVMALLWRVSRPAPIEEFWAPFSQSPDSVLFCVADQNHYSTIMLRDAVDPKRETTLSDHMVTVIIDDLGPLVNIAGLLQAHGRSYRVLGESVATLTDLRQGPAVFIGAFDNGWTLRTTEHLRFHFANNSQMTNFWIEDRDHPEKRDWLLDRSQQETGTYKDYAIVARLMDPTIGQFVVVAAGIARGGTVAAGEFLVDARHLDEFVRQAPKGWSHRNVEIVLETQVIESRSGPPVVDAVYVW